MEHNILKTDWAIQKESNRGVCDKNDKRPR